MASRALFQALLLAASLGWNGVVAWDENSNSTLSSASLTAYAPVVGVSETSLVVPTMTSTYKPPIPLTPVIRHSYISLEVPAKASTSSSSSSRPIVAPSPVTGHTDLSLDIPSTPPSVTPSPATGHSDVSLDIPITTPSPPIAYSPVTGHSQSSLEVPPTTTTQIAPIAVTGKSETELMVPTRRPTGGSPSEHDNGQPTPHPAHNQHEGEHPGEGNPGGIIASLTHEHGKQWTTGGDQPGPQTTEASAQGSTYHLMGTQIVAGASAATIGGTTYSLAPSGDGIYVNGHQTTFTGPAATDSVAMALMSALGSGKATTSNGGEGGTSTLATTTSSASLSAQESGVASAGAAEQTGGAAALVVPGVGLGGVSLLMALL